MTADSPYPGIPITQLTIKNSVSISAYGVIVDNGPGLFLLSDEGGGGSSCSCILDASLISPVLVSDFVPIVRSGVVYLATVADVLNATHVVPSTPYLNFSIAANSMYVGVF